MRWGKAEYRINFDFNIIIDINWVLFIIIIINCINNLITIILNDKYVFIVWWCGKGWCELRTWGIPFNLLITRIIIIIVICVVFVILIYNRGHHKWYMTIIHDIIIIMVRLVWVEVFPSIYWSAADRKATQSQLQQMMTMTMMTMIQIIWGIIVIMMMVMTMIIMTKKWNRKRGKCGK